jgi:hypothetical protein
MLTDSLAARRGHSLTSTLHGHHFKSKLNRLVAGIGSKGSEEGRNAPFSVQARLLPFPTRQAAQQLAKAVTSLMFMFMCMRM